jgi:hypothetical protein
MHPAYSVTGTTSPPSDSGREAQVELLVECTGSRVLGGLYSQTSSETRAESCEREGEVVEDDWTQTHDGEKVPIAISHTKPEQRAGTQFKLEGLNMAAEMAHKQLCLSKMWQLAMEMNAVYASNGRSELFSKPASCEAFEQSVMKTLNVLNNELQDLASQGTSSSR